MTDALRDLATSTRQFYERFNVTPTLHPDALQNFREEVREFIEAAELGENRDHIAEEAADVGDRVDQGNARGRHLRERAQHALAGRRDPQPDRRQQQPQPLRHCGSPKY